MKFQWLYPKKVFEVLFLVLIGSLFQSCKKDPSESTDTITEKYIIEMNSDYRLLNVSYIGRDLGQGKSFSYAGREVQVTDYSGTGTYYLNDIGLADSSRHGTILRVYKYDSDNFLFSYKHYPQSGGYDIDDYIFTNLNGNRIASHEMQNDRSDLYYFNSSTNLIDIESFNGPFLGKLNTNLISRKIHKYGAHGREKIDINYDYKLNSEGLVIQRTGTAIDYGPKIGDPPMTITITNFEYIISN